MCILKKDSFMLSLVMNRKREPRVWFTDFVLIFLDPMLFMLKQ